MAGEKPEAGHEPARTGVVRVGEGRGFVLQARRRGGRVVVTAAHCLPELPPLLSLVDERTYAAIIGPIGGELTVPAECLFLDLIADIALLGTPDNRAYPAQSATFSAFVEDLAPFRVSLLDDRSEIPVRILSLEGEWLPGQATSFGEGLFLSDCEVIDEMAGSPIVTMDGAAVGVVGTEVDMPMSRLGDRLPSWSMR
jgi:hypothetical protein